ncbi:sensor histidine kinase [Pseudoalteromonas peptidolytica]|uniref:sensor histidine kinase n=1 Tax=Pseudoalteromonas peptidolytica TaxID=61150 RepID=UPI00298E6CC0|nr:ATP-binding protein [Pseudoalteromonas peptidolytica]MDW7551518.1 ATP-binding protein [Pseudoalteromonas peptidolytica]
MVRLTQHPTVIFMLTIFALLLSSGASLYLYIQVGFSATWLLITLIAGAFVLSLYYQFNKQNKHMRFVLKSLANGDSSLGLSQHHPMRTLLEEIKDRIQSAHFIAQQQAHFLQTLLVHIDLAVLVFDNKGNVIESNPAVPRLLGKTINHIEDLAHIAPLIHECDNRLKTIANWQYGEQQDNLSIQITSAQIQGQIRKIVTLQSIKDALQNKEQQAYKRLTKVLTHEVANSITPLASIAQTCESLLPESLSFDDKEDKQDLALALRTLAKRTEYLGEFIARFRKVSSLPSPELQPCQLATLVKGIYQLHQPSCDAAGLSIKLDVHHDQLVMLDPAQIEQVLINLLKNAMEALHHQSAQSPQQPPFIVLKTGVNGTGQHYIEISDNGPGIAEHVVDMIFVPFFTTKQQGSGIGLSLSRQIMLNHGGELVYIQRKQGACFRCVFG